MRKLPRILKYTAEKADEGRAVREIIKHEFRLVAHDIARAKHRTERGITVNGECALTSRILKEGDVVEVILADEEPERTVPAEGPLEILYEDEDLICLNKPPGVVVHPSHGHFCDSLGNALAWYFQEKGEPHEIRMVGRLDKDTSGVICFGKSRTACAHLAGQTGNAPAKKEYLALAEGVFAEPEGFVDAPISREYEEKIRRVVRADGNPAYTSYRVLEQYDGYALLSVDIMTGRTHQIRVHMAHIGHPLLGDPIYGGQSGLVRSIHRAALHAWKLTFTQPFTGEVVTVTAPLPEDMHLFCCNSGAHRL